MALRDLVLRFMSPAKRAAAEAESRKWLATCEHCHQTESIWDLGGLRYKGAGRPVMRKACPNCGRWSSFHVFWGGEEPAPPMHDTALSFLGPEARARAEEESKHWICECPHCQQKTSLWDMGGIRYKAAGDGSWSVFRCTNCGKSGWHHIVWDGTPTSVLDAAAAAAKPAPPPSA